MVCFVGFHFGQSKIPRKGAILLKKFNDNVDRYAVVFYRCLRCNLLLFFHVKSIKVSLDYGFVSMLFQDIFIF